VDAHDLRREVERRGLVVLGVGQHRANALLLVVYLHGNEGQWANGYARSLIASIPGVISATDSVQSPAVVLVRVEGELERIAD
jgi:hypothetical protein